MALSYLYTINSHFWLMLWVRAKMPKLSLPTNPASNGSRNAAIYANVLPGYVGAAL